MAGSSGTRRDVLRRGTAAVAATGLVATAGCTGLLGGDGGGSDTDGGGTDGDGGSGGTDGDGGSGGTDGDGGSGGTDAGGDADGSDGGSLAAFEQWAPEPGVISDAERYAVNVRRLASLGEHEAEFGSRRWDLDSMEEEWASSDIRWQDVELHLEFTGVHVLEGTFDRSEVLEAYDDAGYSEEGEREGYTLVHGPREVDQRVAAVGDGTVVFAGDGYMDFENPADVVETAIDTSAGKETRYVEANEYFDELADVMRGGDVVTAFTREPTADGSGGAALANEAARGERWTVLGEKTEGTWGLVFEDADALDVDEVEEWVELNNDANGGEFGRWDDVELTIDGRTAVVDAVADTADL